MNNPSKRTFFTFLLNLSLRNLHTSILIFHKSLNIIFNRIKIIQFCNKICSHPLFSFNSFIHCFFLCCHSFCFLCLSFRPRSPCLLLRCFCRFLSCIRLFSRINFSTQNPSFSSFIFLKLLFLILNINLQLSSITRPFQRQILHYKIINSLSFSNIIACFISLLAINIPLQSR